MCDWVCYLIMSLDSNDTYIGSSNNQPRRLNDHNNTGVGRRGAKRTKGQTWIPVIIVSGFENKRSCLSFEAGWKRLSKRRNKERLKLINFVNKTTLSYSRDTRWNRIIDLLYFSHNFTFIDTKFMLNRDIKHPINYPIKLIIQIFSDDWIQDLPWPYFMETEIIYLKN